MLESSLGVLRFRPLIVALPRPTFSKCYNLKSYISIVLVDVQGLWDFRWGMHEDRSAKLPRACLNNFAYLLTTRPPVLLLKVAVVHLGLFFCRSSISQ